METIPTQAPARGIRPLISLRRHWRAGALTGLAILLVSIPLVWVKGKSHYVAQAIFQVAPSYQKTLAADKELELQSNSQYREFVNHQSRTVLRYDVLERALSKLRAEGAEARLPGEDDRKTIERLQRTVYVYAIPDTYMVRIGLHAEDPANLDLTVNAILDAFVETARNEQIYGSDERMRVLTERRSAVLAEISTFEKQRAELAGLLGLTTFGENTANPYDALLAQAREKLTAASIERSNAKAALAAFKSQGEAPASAGRSVLEMRLQDNGLQALRNEVVKRSEELGRTMAGLEERHPARQPAKTELGEIGSRLQQREEAFERSAQKNLVSRMTASVQQTSQVERELRDRVRALEAQASVFATNFRQAMHLSGEIRRREQESEDIRNRFNYVNTERSAIGFVRPITRALPAVVPQGVGKTRLLLLALLCSIGISLALPTLLDILDRRILTLGDAERAFGTASAAWMVQVRDSASGILRKDQIRRFASTLLRNQARGASHAFAFTSVKVGGGATVVALDVAATLQHLGTRTLVVDANSLAINSGLASSSPGLSEMLADRASFDEVISYRQHNDQRLPLVNFGQGGDTGIHRLDILRKALAHWSQSFDIILVDTTPLLPSADAELLIDTIGQVFLVVETETVSKAELAKARHVIEKLSPAAVGLIVNKVPAETQGPALTSQLIETITRGRFDTFMSRSNFSLQIEMWRALWQRRKMKSSGASITAAAD